MHLINKVSLDQLPEVVSRFSLFVSSDSGPVYIADAVGVPTLVYAGPCHMHEQRPTGNCMIVEPKEVDGGGRKSYIFDTLKFGRFIKVFNFRDF